VKFGNAHLAYCTNIHPAETWAETFGVLGSHVMAVRDRLESGGQLPVDGRFAIGLRLSAVAAKELLDPAAIRDFKTWLSHNNAYVFTINGFPYGSFHGTRVKEQVFRPDWSTRERLGYTKNLFQILAEITPAGGDVSVSTLPGSHKTFGADEELIRSNLIELAVWLDALAAETGVDFHLGLEPEPLGHFENTVETLAFFQRLQIHAPDKEIIRKRIGVNYDACHFALEYDDARESLDALHMAGIRISKIHLSSALRFDPRDPEAIAAIRAFDEPTYFHQTLLRDANGNIRRFIDLPAFLECDEPLDAFEEARVHFHIPLDAEPALPLRSTRDQALDVLAWRSNHPDACSHFEIETYTWGVLPSGMQRNVIDQIAGEYRWVLQHASFPAAFLEGGRD